MNNEYAAQEASDRFEAEQRFVRRMEPIAQEVVEEINEAVEQLKDPTEDEIYDLIIEIIDKYNLEENEREFVILYCDEYIQ